MSANAYLVTAFDRDNGGYLSDGCVYKTLNLDGSLTDGVSTDVTNGKVRDKSPIAKNGSLYYFNAFQYNDERVMDEDGAIGFSDFTISGPDLNVNDSAVLDNDSVYINEGDTIRSLNQDYSVANIENWSYTPNDTVNHTPLLENGYVTFGDSLGNIYRLNSSTGERSWSSPDQSFYGIDRPSPVESSDYIIFITTEGEILKANKENGSLTELNQFPSTVSSTPVVVNNKLYVGYDSGKIREISISDGSVGWEKDFGGGGPLNSGIIHNEGTLYYCDVFAELHALNTSDGSMQWRFEVDPYEQIETVPTYYKGNLYFTTADTATTYCVDENGNKQWDFQPSESVDKCEASPTVVEIKDGGGVSSGLRATQQADGGIYFPPSPLSEFIFEKGLRVGIRNPISNNYVKQEGINVSDTGDSKFSFISGNGLGIDLPEEPNFSIYNGTSNSDELLYSVDFEFSEDAPELTEPVSLSFFTGNSAMNFRSKNQDIFGDVSDLTPSDYFDSAITNSGFGGTEDGSDVIDEHWKFDTNNSGDVVLQAKDDFESIMSSVGYGLKSYPILANGFSVIIETTGGTNTGYSFGASAYFAEDNSGLHLGHFGDEIDPINDVYGSWVESKEYVEIGNSIPSNKELLFEFSYNNP